MMERITATELMELASQHGYPRVVVEYPDGKSRFHIAGTPDGWILALPYLEQDGVLELVYRTLLNPQLSTPPPLPPPPPLPEMFSEREPLVWNLLDEWFVRAFQPDDLQAIRVMLAYAEACEYPELALEDYNYTIPNDLAGWLTAAKLMCGTPAVALTTELLRNRLYPQQQLPLQEG
jgi:hypothetical protein